MYSSTGTCLCVVGRETLEFQSYGGGRAKQGLNTKNSQEMQLLLSHDLTLSFSFYRGEALSFVSGENLGRWVHHILHINSCKREYNSLQQLVEKMGNASRNRSIIRVEVLYY